MHAQRGRREPARLAGQPGTDGCIQLAAESQLFHAEMPREGGNRTREGEC